MRKEAKTEEKSHPKKSFALQINVGRPTILEVFCFRVVNEIGILLENILEIESFQMYEGWYTTLRQTRFFPNSESQLIVS